MTKYVVKHDSISLPPEKESHSGRIIRKGGTIELTDEQAARLLEFDAVEEVSKSETKSDDEKPPAPRGRGAAKPADS